MVGRFRENENMVGRFDRVFPVRKCRKTAAGKTKALDYVVPNDGITSSSPATLLIGPIASALADEWDIQSSKSEFNTPKKDDRPRRIRNKDVVLPKLKLKASKVPGGGLGVFAEQEISEGEWVTEYGGEIIDSEEASSRRKKGEDTHIRSLGYKDICLDSRLRDSWMMEYYVRNHMVGGFLNDSHGTELSCNCEYVTVDGTMGYQHPYEGSPWVSKRVFLRALCDIPAGEELLVSYGRGYHANHFDD